MEHSKNIIQNQNEALVLENIINEKEISRSELASLINLSKPSVSAIVSKLMKKSLIYESHTGESSQAGGRRPIYLKFNPNVGSIISIDIRSDSINSILTTLDGKIINKISITNNIIDQTTIMEQLTSLINTYIKEQPDTRYNIIGIGIAIHGVVLNNDIRFTPYYSLNQINLYEELSNYYDIPVYIENEANLGALGEYVFSTSYSSLVNINIHHGVGAGIIEDGEILIGQRGYIGEMGHSILFPNGKDCPCGNKGCLEQYISDKIIIKLVSDLKKEQDLILDDVIAYGKAGDVRVTKILEQLAIYLSIGINNLICFYDPEIVIINSEIYNAFPELIDTVNKNLSNKASTDIPIIGTKLDGNSTLYGCISLVLRKSFMSDKIKFN